MIGRALYAFAFVVAIPAALVLFASRLEQQLNLPSIQSPLIGSLIAALGLTIVAAAWFALFRFAGGLPMNAFPPKTFTRRGIYRWVDDPIYIGFVLVVLGVSIALGSIAGVWIVTPLAAAGSCALVVGYERHDLQRRFGKDRARARFKLPADEDRPPHLGERAGVLILLFLPWLILYEAIGHLPVPGAIETWLPFERQSPVLQWTEIFYVSVYPVVVLAPCIARRASDLRRFAQSGYTATGLAMLIYLLVPFIAPPRTFESTNLLGDLLLLERSDGLAGRAAFPAFHVFWAIAAANLWRTRSTALAWLTNLWLILAIASCWTTGMHSIADLIAGVALYAIARTSAMWWRASLRACQAIANSWREWRVGPIRIINHAIYAGIAAGAGMLITTWLVGVQSSWALAGVALAALAGAAIWGQILVGGKALLRPFGYFGSVLGAGLAFLIMTIAGSNVWPLSAGLATAAPFVQAIGRNRCLIQGCCHGAPAKRGIVYRQPTSRVVYLSKLANIPLHPTPLYSMIANLVIGLLLLRLWIVGANAGLIIGGYLILSGLSRFVEESYRGEVQTQTLLGLRIYQVFAAISVAAGMIVSSISTAPVQAQFAVSIEQLTATSLVGVLYFLAMGVDLPGSNLRFARLA